MRNAATVLLLLLPVVVPASAADVQQTTGNNSWCSPAQNGNGNQVICNGVDPRAMALWNELLANQNLSLQQNTAEANELAKKYNDLSARFEEAKRQQQAFGEDPNAIQAAQELLHQGKLEEALKAIIVADMKKKISFQVLSDDPGRFRLLINNATDQVLDFPHSKLIISGQPSQTFEMGVGGTPGGPPSVAFPPFTQAPVASTLFNCVIGHDGKNTLFAMRYGPNPSLDQRQCKICIEARNRNGDSVEPCEDLPCSAIVIPALDQKCSPSPMPNAGACRMPDGSISPLVSPSGCVARGGSWLSPTSTSR